MTGGERESGGGKGKRGGERAAYLLLTHHYFHVFSHSGELFKIYVAPPEEVLQDTSQNKITIQIPCRMYLLALCVFSSK